MISMVISFLSDFSHVSVAGLYFVCFALVECSRV